MTSGRMDRRTLIGGLAGSTGLLLSGCDRLDRSPTFRSVLQSAEGLNYHAQRLVAGRDALAIEYSASDMSPIFRVNGTAMPASEEYAALLANDFADYRLIVDGLVARPLALSLPDLMLLPQRTQITRHDCVEGWSAIGKWRGPQLGTILRLAGLSNLAKFIVFHCADKIGSAQYYESIDLIDAFHPQTIMALFMNDRKLSVSHGAPTRLRVERQLGYKNAKFVMRIEARQRIDDLYRGKGGFWEDNGDYAWYAGI